MQEPFFHSIIQITGTLIGLILVLAFLSYISSLLSKFTRIKPQTTLAILPDAEGKKLYLPKSVPVILQIDLKGVIGKEELNLDTIETQLIESQMGELRGSRIKGLLLNIDSPGGAATDSDSIYRRIKAYKEKYQIPVYAYVDGYCASGGLFAACAADKIFATPSSIVGSVGVLWMLPFFNVHKLLDKWEIGVKTFAEGKHKDHLNPFRPWQKGEDADLTRLLHAAYERFVHVVSKERPKLTQEKLIDEIGAQVYSAPESARIGFIDDGESDYPDALKALLEAARIKQGDPYQVVALKKKKAWLKEMVSRSPIFTGKIKHEIQLGNCDLSIEQRKAAYLFIS